ncbi:uncharacterized protein JCM10292_002478, partial [Rhodotorula paludigena]|uniref:uncharacterized protein n=1 Tax=Rhodotorula paludigena TaxID=86838 RepID=UPI00317EF20D
MAALAPQSAAPAPAPSRPQHLAADPMSSRVDVLATDAGRILCVADIRGSISTLNALAAEHSAVAIIHSGDFGFYEPSSLETISDRTLKHLIQYSSLITPTFRAQLLSPNTTPALQRELLASPPKTAFPDSTPASPAFGLSEFPKLLTGELRLNVPVYTVWGACEDVSILEKIRLAPPSAQSIPSDPSKLAPAPLSASTRPSSVPSTPPSYSIPNLTVLDEATTRVLLIGGVRLRLFGLGGAVVPHKLFDNGTGTATIAGGQGTMWTTMLQIGELVDTAQKVYDPSETRLLISHASPGREGLLSQLALVLKADLTVSAGLHFRYGVSYNEFSVQHDPDAFKGKLEAARKSFAEIWDHVKNQVESVVDENQRTLLQNALAVANRIPTSNLSGGGAAIEETAWKNCWNWNLPDAAYGSLVLDIREGRIGSEMKSQGFNFAYRQNAPRPPVPSSAPSPAPTGPSTATRPAPPVAPSSTPAAAAAPTPSQQPQQPSAPSSYLGPRGFPSSTPNGSAPTGTRPSPGPGPVGHHPHRTPSGPRGGAARGGFAAPGGWGHAGAASVSGQVVGGGDQTSSQQRPAQQQQQQGRGPRNAAPQQQQQQQGTPTAASVADASGTPVAPAQVKKTDSTAAAASDSAAPSNGSASKDAAPAVPATGDADAVPASPSTPTAGGEGSSGAEPSGAQTGQRSGNSRRGRSGRGPRGGAGRG